MIPALVLSLVLLAPNADSPPCEDGVTVDCVQMQLPEETNGRVITDAAGNDWEMRGGEVNPLPAPVAPPVVVSPPVAKAGPPVIHSPRVSYWIILDKLAEFLHNLFGGF